MIATHAKRARRESRCPLCPAPITVGQRIVKIGRGGNWLHLACFNRRYRTTTEGE